MSLFSDNLNKGLVYSATDLKISDMREQSHFASVVDTKKYEQIEQRCQKTATFSTTADESGYHFKLGLIYSSPYVIYRQGNIDMLNKHILTIVGPRNYSSYGQQVMEELFSILPQYDVVTISGLAPGIDMMAHEMSIASGIPTIAVLGGGLKRFTESKNREIIKKIVDNGGLILSEFKLDKEPEKYTFPQRNRIVAGLSDMVFLPEAGEKSGSLITVDFARQMHKDVYGAPSNMFSLSSKGLLHYMQQGLVQPVVKFEQMLDKYFGKKVNNGELKIQYDNDTIDPEIRNHPIFVMLQKDSIGLTMSELARETSLDINDLMSQLGMREVMGIIKSDGEKWRIR